MSIRSGASVSQLLAFSVVPVGGKISRVFLRGLLMMGSSFAAMCRHLFEEACGGAAALASS